VDSLFSSEVKTWFRALDHDSSQWLSSITFIIFLSLPNGNPTFVSKLLLLQALVSLVMLPHPVCDSAVAHITAVTFAKHNVIYLNTMFQSVENAK
jgi:hypothetical protein